MIIGIGTDIVSIERIEKLLHDHPERFVRKYFTQEERNAAPAQNKAGYYAKRFAAKEALVKALGTGFSDGISWQDMSVSNTQSGKPEITLSGEALRQFNLHFQKGTTLSIHVSLSDEREYALAFVVIERVHQTI